MKNVSRFGLLSSEEMTPTSHKHLWVGIGSWGSEALTAFSVCALVHQWQDAASETETWFISILLLHTARATSDTIRLPATFSQLACFHAHSSGLKLWNYLWHSLLWGQKPQPWTKQASAPSRPPFTLFAPLHIVLVPYIIDNRQQDVWHSLGWKILYH